MSRQSLALFVVLKWHSWGTQDWFGLQPTITKVSGYNHQRVCLPVSLLTTHSRAGTSDSPGVRHFSFLAQSHTHSRASTLIILRPGSLALPLKAFWLMLSRMSEMQHQRLVRGSAFSQEAHGQIPVADSTQSGVEPASTSCILVRAWA